MLSATKVGAALSLTLGVFYAICSALYVAFPAASLAVYRALFHGGATADNALTWGAFGLGLATMLVFGYLVGAIFALISNAIGIASGARIEHRGFHPSGTP